MMLPEQSVHRTSAAMSADSRNAATLAVAGGSRSSHAAEDLAIANPSAHLLGSSTVQNSYRGHQLHHIIIIDLVKTLRHVIYAVHYWIEYNGITTEDAKRLLPALRRQPLLIHSRLMPPFREGQAGHYATTAPPGCCHISHAACRHITRQRHYAFAIYC